MPTAEASQLPGDAQAGRGVVMGRVKLLRLPRCRLLLPASSPDSCPLSSTAWLPSWPEAEQRPRSSGGKWMGTEHQGKGPSAQGRRGLALPRQLPTEFTAQKTPLVHQLHVEVY